MSIKNLKNKFVLLGSAFITLVILATTCQYNTSIEDRDFNDGWRFHKGFAKGAEMVSFNDSNWRELSLPHDWAIEGKFDQKYNARTGGLPVHGTAWYRKSFLLKKDYKDRIISIEFDGAMNNAHIWVNGRFVGKRPNGYIGFEFDITQFVKFDTLNTIAVRLNPEDLSARWYPGAGIYRNVKLKINNQLHIPQYGTYITTPKVSKEKATIEINTNITNKANIEQIALLSTKIIDPSGKIVKQETTNIIIQPNNTGFVKHKLIIPTPKLWDLQSPNLYKVQFQVLKKDKVIDEYTTEFGIRTIKFSRTKGFELNGKQTKLQGVCMHHDLGPLGTAVNYRAIERQMQIMKNMGVNALRTSHNPPAPELLQVCDRLGIVVQVEAFDEWEIGKVPNGYNKYFKKWHEKDLRDMIKRDRNHPCVIMWSIGNEILEQSKKDGWKIAKRLNDICHEEDSTRPTTAGFNYYPAPFTNKLAHQIDIVGLNYWPLNYQEVLDNYPNMIVYGSETSSMTSSRGVYHLPIDANHKKETHQVSSYDVIVGPPWAYPPDVEFDQQQKIPSALGEFMWTGFDYFGEPTPYGGRDNSTNGYWNDDWPSHSACFGPVDLCGFPKDRYYLYQSSWTNTPMVHVLPHWNWEGMEGDTIPVYAYSNCEEVELFVNDKSFGKLTKGKDLTKIPAEFHFYKKGTYESKHRLSWNVPYQPGKIKVVGYNNNIEQCNKVIKTASSPYKIVLNADRSNIKANGKDLSFVTVTAVDKDGIECPLADTSIKFDLSGSGTIAGVGNGNPASLEPHKADNIKLFNGKALIIIQSDGEKDTIELIAKSNDLKNAQIIINTDY